MPTISTTYIARLEFFTWYAPHVADIAPGHLRIAAYARHDYYAILRKALGAVAGRLEDDGWQARVVADDNALVDRAAAVRAGIGWYGKSANVLIPGRGSWFVLGSVVTDAPLPETEPIDDGCGSCQRCLDSCPTGAIVAPGVVDARRCLAWLVQAPGAIPIEFREAMGSRLYGCDDCQEVCPEGREHRNSDDEWDVKADYLASEILEAEDKELLDRFSSWYIAERNPRYLKRNALVSIGNSEERENELFRSLLKKYLLHSDPILRSHAAWASIRLGHRELVDIAKSDSDPLVIEEIMLAEAEGCL